MPNDIRINKSMTLEDMDTPFSTSLGATAEQLFIENPLTALFDYGELQAKKNRPIRPTDTTIQHKPRISQEDALKQVQDAQVSLEIGEQGISQEALDLLIEREREETKRKALMRTAPDGVLSTAAHIGVGLAVSLADPINIASAFIPVVGTARYTNMLAKAGSAGARAGVRVKVGAASGVVGAAVVEPLVLLPLMELQTDYTLYDSLLNITFGGVLGGGLHAGAGAIGDVIARSSGKAKSDMLQGATGQLLDEGEINVSKIAEEHQSFRDAYREVETGRVDADVNASAKNTFNRALDEAELQNVNKAQALDETTIKNAQEGLQEPTPSRADVQEAANTASVKVEDFKSEPLKAPKPKDVDVQEPTPTTPEAEIQSVQQETDDIFTALDELDEFSPEEMKSLKGEIEELNKKSDRDLDGVKAGIMCAVGK